MPKLAAVVIPNRADKILGAWLDGLTGSLDYVRGYEIHRSTGEPPQAVVTFYLPPDYDTDPKDV